MKIIKNPELKGILVMLLIALVLGTFMAGTSGKLEQWGIPWFTGAKVTDKIVYVSNSSGKNDIYMMNLDGSEQKQLTNGIRVLSAPVMSPAGNRIVFIGMSGKASQVFSIGVNGGAPSPLTYTSGTKRQPDYSPDGKMLSYIESGRVYVAEITGGNADTVLPTHTEIHGAASNTMDRGSIPLYKKYAWGPDSKSMAGVTDPQKGIDNLTYLPELEGEIAKLPISENEQINITGMSWARQKPILVASLVIGKKNALLLFDPSQQKLEPILAVNKQELGNPGISPDGSVVVVPVKSSDPKIPSGMLKLDLQSGQAGVLCKGEFENPIYSPKGDSILASQFDEKSGNRSVVTIDPASGNITKLTKDGDCFNATWSPMSEK